MTKELRVNGVIENGSVVLTLSYDAELLLKRGAPEQFSQMLIGQYREIRHQEKVKSGDCVVDIQTEVAGSAVVRALFDLWSVVREGGGEVVCVYPKDYIESLNSLGLPHLGGFRLAATAAEAVEKLSKK